MLIQIHEQKTYSISSLYHRLKLNAFSFPPKIRWHPLSVPLLVIVDKTAQARRTVATGMSRGAALASADATHPLGVSTIFNDSFTLPHYHAHQHPAAASTCLHDHHDAYRDKMATYPVCRQPWNIECHSIVFPPVNGLLKI